MRIMTFNIRYDNPGDGKHQWSNRLPAVLDVWKRTEPDVVGIQEGLAHQVEALSSGLPHYAYVGRGREADGTGEHVAVFYHKERLTPLESGHFWLSDTPDIPGSKSFGNDIVRMTTWVRFNDLQDRTWFIVNTHLDHISEPARQKSATLIIDFIERHAARERVVVTGDFNAPPAAAPIRMMVANGFVDALEKVGHTGPTFHNFQGTGTERIDYIFYRGDGFTVTDGRILTDRYNDVYPSDHYPLFADFT